MGAGIFFARIYLMQNLKGGDVTKEIKIYSPSLIIKQGSIL